MLSNEGIATINLDFILQTTEAGKENAGKGNCRR